MKKIDVRIHEMSEQKNKSLMRKKVRKEETAKWGLNLWRCA